MKIWIDGVVEGNLEFVEGEVDKDKKPTFFLLVEDAQGNETKIFFKSETVQEHKDFVLDVERILRH